jgi:large subunit ribosomal protein L21
MYAVIKTGGKQYRVQAGDVLVVEKLSGEPGAKVAFDQVLMLGDGAGVTVGAPTVEGASVSATLVETRKGEKIKVFKKIRRQGYRRTGGHRQIETVLRVTAITGDGKSETWDGVVDLTPRSVLNLRARGLAPQIAAEAAPAEVAPTVASEPEAKPAKAKAKAKPVESEAEAPAAEAPVVEAASEAAAEAPAKKKAAPKVKAAKPAEGDAAEAEAAPAKKPAAKKAKPAAEGEDA